MNWSMLLLPMTLYMFVDNSALTSSPDGLIFSLFPSSLRPSHPPPCYLSAYLASYLATYLYLSLFLSFFSSLLIFFGLVLNLTLDDINHYQAYEEENKIHLSYFFFLIFFMDSITRIG